MPHKLKVSAPGRICLFGEHQDYLGLPVITAAINLRITLIGQATQDDKIRIDMPDLNEYISFALILPLRYSESRDYLKSTLNVLSRENVDFSHGIDVSIRGTIPINSGTSSSSAMVVAWTAFLLNMKKDPRANDPVAIATLAHRSEVLEFNEPGGMMDHVAATFGGVQYVDFKSSGPQALDAPLGPFVLGDSREPKDTTSILRRVKDGAQEGMRIVGKKITEITLDDVDRYESQLSANQYKVLRANIFNRYLTQVAKSLMHTEPFDHQQFGYLLFKHYEQLRDNLEISTPKIDRMINAAMEAGALGAKINGSGGGGCMFAYAPDHTHQVADAIAREGGKAYIIRVDDGVKIETV